MVSHPLRMRKALGSNPSVSISELFSNGEMSFNLFGFAIIAFSRKKQLAQAAFVSIRFLSRHSFRKRLSTKRCALRVFVTILREPSVVVFDKSYQNWSATLLR